MKSIYDRGKKLLEDCDKIQPFLKALLENLNEYEDILYAISNVYCNIKTETKDELEKLLSSIAYIQDEVSFGLEHQRFEAWTERRAIEIAEFDSKVKQFNENLK